VISTAAWTVFAGIVLVGILVTCIVVVAAGTRFLGNALAKRRQKLLA
jgi:hypothetical protein